MNILVTGNAGFIGFTLVKKLMENTNHNIVGIDSVNDYYDINLKEDRLSFLKNLSEKLTKNYIFYKFNLADSEQVEEVFSKHKFDIVINLAAQAGVRYSLENPHAYIESNVTAYTNLIEACVKNNVKHFVYASTSSVYGGNTIFPAKESHPVDNPLQFYAATKRFNELTAHAYSHLYKLPTTGLRFFTAYGPWGRPDMALFMFTKNILEDKPINVFNYGHHIRDFTYVDDIAEGIIKVANNIPEADLNWDGKNLSPNKTNVPFRVYNIGNNNPVKLLDYVHEIEHVLNKKATINMMPLQAGDVPNIYADTSELEEAVGYKPSTTIQIGVKNFVEWYKAYYK